ncbi:MAG: flagellar biosynthesis anti-sigma factor FlgM [Planctomycetaceae bacterium]|jgi:anti-sigma28 factor (negative regulator of flagellin synthesis)|nr:flagellar biosynthesis anti-sigma factor FlgM [Planctomycetaceae bacterium]
MEINRLQTAQNVSEMASSAKRQNFPASETLRPQIQDDVLFSAEAQKMSDSIQTSEKSPTGEVRFELVNWLRSEIAKGNYDTEERMNAALEKMFAQVGF